MLHEEEESASFLRDLGLAHLRIKQDGQIFGDARVIESDRPARNSHRFKPRRVPAPFPGAKILDARQTRSNAG